MKTFWKAFTFAVMIMGVNAVADERSDYLKQYPAADTNGDGVLTEKEHKDHLITSVKNYLGEDYRFEEFMIPVRDGVKLATIAFIPEGGAPCPVVLIRTAYGKWSPSHGYDYTIRFKGQRIAYVAQDLRGNGDSGGKGTFDPASFDNEINDSYDTVEWLAKQAWCNGRIGMIGNSGHGFAAHMAVLAQPPHLAVIETNWTGGTSELYWTFHNGVRRNEHFQWLSYRGFYAPAWPRPTLSHFSLAEYRKRVETAKQDNHVVFIENTGWFDIFGESALDYFRDFAATGHCYVKFSPRGHANDLRGSLLKYPDAYSLPASVFTAPSFIDILKNKDCPLPPSTLSYYLMGDGLTQCAPGNKWEKTQVWPVPSAAEKSLYLCAGGILDWIAPTDKAASLTFVSDPNAPVPTIGGEICAFGSKCGGVGPCDQRPLKDRKDILRFISAPLKEPLTVIGKIRAELFVSSDAPDTLFTVKLIDVYPNGYEALIRDSAIMARYHDGLEKAAPLEEGKTYLLDVDMWSTALVFDKGHRLAVHIAGSNDPKYEVHPNVYEPAASMKDTRTARNIVHIGPATPTRILLPVVENR